jgi:two-component system NtrC family sensor kinase
LKLAAKLILIIVVGSLVLLAVDGYLSVEREIDLFEADMAHDTLVLGHALEGVVADVWRRGGPRLALEMIEDVDRGTADLQVRLVALGGTPEDLFAPRVPQERLDAVRAGKDLTLSNKTEGGPGEICTYVPINIDGYISSALEISESRAALRSYVSTTIIRRFILLLVMLLVSTGVIVILGLVFVGRPLHRLTETTRRMGAGDLSASVELHGHDELDELADGLNSMGRQLEALLKELQEETKQRIAALQQLRHADRLRTVGRLASGISHELGTPLNVVSGRATLIASGDLSQPEIQESANVIRSQADRMEKIVRQLLDFARRTPSQRAKVDLPACAANVQRLIAPISRKRRIAIEIAGSGSVTAMADETQLEQVLTNLVVNAIQASPVGGRVEITTGRETARPPEGFGGMPGTYAFVRVQDEGEGIKEENIKHLFEPFFTTKDIGEGTGLGLSIAYSIVQDHGGWIDVQSRHGQGSRFTVYLPEE